MGCPGGIHVLVHQRRAGVHVQPDQDVGRRAPAQLVGDREDLAAGDVEHRGPGDADRRADVAAGQVARRNRCPDVAGPQDGAGVGGQRVDGVVLGRHVDAPGRLERLAVDLPVEHRRGPRRGRRGEGDARGVDPGPERVAVVDGPRRGGIDVRRAGRTGRRSAQAAPVVTMPIRSRASPPPIVAMRHERMRPCADARGRVEHRSDDRVRSLARPVRRAVVDVPSMQQDRNRRSPHDDAIADVRCRRTGT